MEAMSDESKVAAPTASRRRVLKLGLAGAALLLLGGSGLALYPSRACGAPTAPLVALDERAFQVLVAVAARIVTAAGADPVAIAQGVDRALSYALAETQSDVRALLGLFENALAGFVFDLRVTPFTRLSPSAQDAALESWRTSRLVVRRTGYQALRKLCLASFYVQEASWSDLGYAPPSGLNAAAYDDPEIGTPEWLEAQNKVRGS
jgi:hypothetical protein